MVSVLDDSNSDGDESGGFGSEGIGMPEVDEEIGSHAGHYDYQVDDL